MHFSTFTPWLARGVPSCSYKNLPLRRNQSTLHEFVSLGLSPPVVNSLREAFPHITAPSPCQRGLIPAVLRTNAFGLYRDVILKGDTGTGKSFGLLLALLCKSTGSPPNSHRKSHRISTSPSSTLVIVPHRELAYQYHHWIQRLFPDEHQNMAQLCIRGDPQHPLPVHLLRGSPAALLKSSVTKFPPLLISTPPALVELLNASPISPFDSSNATKSDKSRISTTGLPISALTLNISTVLVDEIDSLLSLPPRNASTKVVQAWYRHVPLTVQILDSIYGSKRDENIKRAILPRPQLLLASATMGSHVRGYIFSQTKWLRKPVDEAKSIKDNDSVVKLDYSTKPSTLEQGSEDKPSELLKETVVEHSCIVVSEDGSTRNIDMTTEERDVSQPLDEKEKRYLQALHQKAEAERRSRPQETKPSSPLIQSLAVAFALDVPSLALLVVPSTYNIRQIVAEFRELGVDARPVDLTESSGGRSNLAGMVQARSNDDPPTSTTSSDSPTTTTEKVDTEDKAPVLLISTLATTRGLDFPSLTHVFLLGPEVAKVKTDYDHVAGRVGRFAKAGKVVTFVEEPVSEDPTLPVPYDGERMMRRLYSKLGITPRKFDLDSYVV